MESYGAILKKTREEKQLTHEEIARETSIKAEYLKAIEEEDSNVFQEIGETYYVGFFRNYSDYLGCETQTLMNLYRAKQIQESPVPEGLIEPHRPRYLIPLIVCISVLAAGLAVFGVILAINHSKKNNSQKEESQSVVYKSYELNDKPFNGRIYIGDKIIIPSKDGEILITVAETLGTLALETPVGLQKIELSEELELDINGDARNDIIIYLSDISSKNEKNGAEVRLLLMDSTGTNTVVDTKAIPNISEVNHADTKVVIFEDTRAYPFTLNISFRSGSLVRYKVDRRDIIEDYYEKGDLITMTASNGVRLWSANGNASSIQVLANSKTYDLEVVKGGQVIAEDIKWIRDTDGKYKLVVLNLD